MAQNGVIETSSGDLLRAGYSDFLNDGSFDSGTETYKTDVPIPAKVKYQSGETQMNRWNGSAWVLVSQPTVQPETISGSGTIVIDCQNKSSKHVHVTATGTLTIEAENFSGTDQLFLCTAQDSTGGYAITLSATYFEQSTPNPTLTTTANSVDTWIFGKMGSKFHQHAFEKDVK